MVIVWSWSLSGPVTPGSLQSAIACFFGHRYDFEGFAIHTTPLQFPLLQMETGTTLATQHICPVHREIDSAFLNHKTEVT